MHQNRTITEAADYLRVPVATLRYWRAQGLTGPRAIKVGRHLIYRQEELDRFLDELEAQQAGSKSA